ncbi:MAG: hypothetical protein [Bacteriophage sp.]|nr:MAG: hypothetical protein [Bacteriophage sp.]
MKRHAFIYEDIKRETERQDKKWGIQFHTPEVWLAILGEEVGESNKAFLEHMFGNKSTTDLRAELVQVAAVAVQFIEQLDNDFNPQLN